MKHLRLLIIIAVLLFARLVIWADAGLAQSRANRNGYPPSSQDRGNGYQKADPIRLRLVNDTAPGQKTNEDRVTSDPTIAGQVTKPELLGALTARFNNGRAGQDITSLVTRDGRFILHRSDLARILGYELKDGFWVLHIEAMDGEGTILHAADIVFTLDTTPPASLLFDPVNLETTNLQLGYIEIALGHLDTLDTAMIDAQDIVIRNGTRLLPVQRTEITSDGLVRYYYEGDLEKGEVEVTFSGDEVSDLAGNINVRNVASFDFDPFDPGFNGLPQRSARMQIEPNINPPYNEDSGASIYLHSGEAFLRRVDLVIPGRGFNFEFERIYRSGWNNYRTPLGHNWDFSYNRRLLVVTNPKKVKKVFPTAKLFDVVRIDGKGRHDLYSRIPGTGHFKSPAGFFTRLVEENNIFYERDRDGNVIVYQPTLGGGKALPMTSYTDRNGNSMTFHYDEGRLIEVVDTLGRSVAFFYLDDLLVRVRDFVGREIRFTYDDNGDLQAVTGPAVTDTPHGNDFQEGKTETYSYDTSSNIYRRHNLLTVTAPNEVAMNGPAREIYVYDDHDRVSKQMFGGTNRSGIPAGAWYSYRYLNRGSSVVNPNITIAFSLSAVDFTGPQVVVEERLPTTSVTDRNGNVTNYEFSSLGNWQRTREFTNRDIRVADPGAFIEVHKYDQDGQRLTITHHEGNKTRYVFDANNSDRLQQGNILAFVLLPDDDSGGDQGEIKTNYTYEPIYNQRRQITEPRGIDPSYRPTILTGEVLPNRTRFTTVHTFDYQEGQNYSGLAQKTGTTSSQVQALLAEAGIPMGLGDVNGDGRTNQINGNIIRT
jgi:YD repeat-containing protein